MTRLARLLMFGYLVASLCGFLETCSDLALAESAADLMRVEKAAFKVARDQEAANYYSKALDIGNYYSKALEANPNLVEQQEEWVRARVKNGESADLLERIDPEFRGLSLPSRKDLIEKNHKGLIIRASFLERLISDFNDGKVYRKGINIRNALIIGDLDLSRVEISPSVSITRSILFGDVDLRDTRFQNELDWSGSHFLKEMKSGLLKVGRSAVFSKAVFRGPVDFHGANIAGVFDADEARFDSDANFRSLAADTALFSKSVFRGAVNFNLAKITTNFDALEIRFEDTKSEAEFQYFDGGQLSSFSKAVFRGPAAFVGAKTLSIFLADKARFESKVDFSSLNAGGDAVLVQAVFRGPVIFRGAKILSRFMADNAHFESKADFISLDVGVGASFSKAVFRGPALFAAVNTVMFNASEARFESEAKFSYFRVGDSAMFFHAIFPGPVIFLETNISRNFLGAGARFESSADFLSLKVGGEASFNKAVFRGPVNFEGANISRNFDAGEARFESTGSKANFTSMKVGHAASFKKAVFLGPVDFQGANISTIFNANEARFQSTDKKALFDSMHVGDTVFLEKAIFRGPVDFRLANIESQFLAGKARFEAESNFTSLTVGGSAYFEGSNFRGVVSFRQANIGTLFFLQTKFQEKTAVLLDGLTYKNIYTESADYKGALRILSRMPHYYPQPYKQLESCYTEAGRKEWADAVFVEGKWQEWNAAGQGRYYLPANVLKLGAAWLSRALNMVIYFVIGFIVCGTFVFSRPRIFQDEKKLSGFRAFWYSLGLFLPFVRLGPEKFYRIDKEGYFSVVPSYVASSLPCWFVMRLQFSGEIYYYVHQLSGYILLSIGIIAIAGIIK